MISKNVIAAVASQSAPAQSNYFVTFDKTNYIDLGFFSNNTTVMDFRASTDVITGVGFEAFCGARDNSSNNDKSLGLVSGNTVSGPRNFYILNNGNIEIASGVETGMAEYRISAAEGLAYRKRATDPELIPLDVAMPAYTGTNTATMIIGGVKTANPLSYDDLTSATYDWFLWYHDGNLRLLQFTEGSGNTVYDTDGNAYTIQGNPVTWTATSDPVKQMPDLYTAVAASAGNGDAFVNSQPFIVNLEATLLDWTTVADSGYEFDSWDIGTPPTKLTETITATASFTEKPVTSFIDVRNPPPPFVGATGDGVTDDTAAVNNIISNFSNVQFTTGTYMIDPDVSIQVNTGQHLRINSDATVEAITTNTANHRIFKVWSVDNVIIDGTGTIKGERNTHTGTTGEGGMGIGIRNCDNVLVDGPTVIDCWGDGIYTGKVLVSDPLNTNIIIRNVNCDRNRRQGISITHDDGTLVEDALLTNTNGTLPECGIDIEPNSTSACRNITLRRLTCYGNVEHGILATGFFAECSNITVEDCVCYNNGHSGIRLRAVDDISMVRTNSHGNNGGQFNGAGLEVTRDLINASFSDCYFGFNDGNGFQINGNDDFQFGAHSITMDNCTFENNSQVGANLASGLRLEDFALVGSFDSVTVTNSDFVDITGSKVVDGQNYTQSAHTQRWGVLRTGGDGSRISVDGTNTFAGNVAGDKSGL